MEKTSFFDRLNNWIKRSVTVKLFSIGFLILILLIPTSMLQSLISERQDIRDSAIEEVSSKWGGRQTIGGPVLSVPYNKIIKDDKGNYETIKSYAHFLPEQLNITGKILPEKRYRGIYVVVLYNTVLHVTGKFPVPDYHRAELDSSSVLPDEAFLSIGISDLKGVKDNIVMKMQDSVLTFGPGIPTHDILVSGVSVKCSAGVISGKDFSFDLNLNGSTNLSFLPFGKETNVNLESAWGNPSFEGSFLPDKRDVTETGFTSSWKVLQLNRNYPQQGVGSFIGDSDSEDYESGHNGYSDFGVRLLLPVDEYLKTMRSVKYCLMLIIITFLTFFFVEVLNKKRIHPIQYLLVGFAVCLFYVLLLSISEQISFGPAYLVSSVAIISLITFYAKHIFRNGRLTIVFSSLLILLYGFFYSLLQLEDYALLLGSIGLFIILSTIMYLTRKVNWYGQESE
jgi:inner membrane protein